MIFEKEKVSKLSDTEAPSRPFSIPNLAAAKLKVYPCFQAAESQRHDTVFECSLSIEAVRAAILKEMRDVIEFDGSYNFGRGKT